MKCEPATWHLGEDAARGFRVTVDERWSQLPARRGIWRIGQSVDTQFLDIYEIDLARECHPVAIIHGVLLQNGLEVEREHLVETEAGINGRVLARGEYEGRKSFVEVTALKSGVRVYLLCLVSIEEFPTVETARVFSSFQLANCENQPFAEQLEMGASIGDTRFVFWYPASWTLNDYGDTTTIRCHDPEIGLYGCLAACSGLDNRNKLVDVLADIIQTDVSANPELDFRAADFASGHSDDLHFPFSAGQHGIVDVRLTLFRDQERTVALGTVAVDRASSNTSWGVIDRGFDIIKKSFAIL